MDELYAFAVINLSLCLGVVLLFETYRNAWLLLPPLESLRKCCLCGKSCGTRTDDKALMELVRWRLRVSINQTIFWDERLVVLE